MLLILENISCHLYVFNDTANLIKDLFNFIIVDLGSTASSGRRSNVFGEKYGRQGSMITSGKASIASGSLVSTGLPIPEGIDTANLTPQQLGVMGE